MSTSCTAGPAVQQCGRWSLSQSTAGCWCLRFNGFPGEPGLAGFIEAKDDGGGVENWSCQSCKAPVKSSPPTKQHPTLYRPDALPVTQPTVSEHCTENTTFCGIAHPKLSGRLPTLSLTTNSS